MITRQQLEIINRKTLKYPLHIAEKDYFLALVLKLIDLFLILDRYPMNLDEIVGYIKQKEIRRPITKSNIKDNWSVIHTRDENELDRTYYLRQINDKEIEELIEKMPFDNIA